VGGFGAVLPLIATGASTVVGVGQAINARNVASFNAQSKANDAKEAQMQAAAEEEQLRREQRAFLGKQRAAFAEAGIGPGGTAGLIMDQSDVLAELDALNIRYGGQMRSKGLIAQASAESRSKKGTALLAGSQVLYGASRAYTQRRLIEGE
jgi:hypothetical protein